MNLPKRFLDPPGSTEVEVESLDFNAPHGRPERASESIDIGTPAAIDRDFAVVHSPKLTGCITKVFGQAVARQSARHHGPHSPKVGQPTAYRKSFADLADETDAIRLEMPVTQGGVTVPFYFDLIFIRDGNASIQLYFENVFAPFDISDVLNLARLAVQRLDAATKTATIATR
jgi:hypothetical protein